MRSSSFVLALTSSIAALVLAYTFTGNLNLHRAFLSSAATRRYSTYLTKNTTDSIVHQAVASMSTAGNSRRPARPPVLAVETPEGDGAVVRRSIGGREVRNFSPFLSEWLPQSLPLLGTVLTPLATM